MRDTKRRPRAFPALTVLLGLVVLVPWLICMGLLTAVFAHRQAETTLTWMGSRAYEAQTQTDLPWEDVSGWRTPGLQVTSALFDTQGNCLGGSWETFVSLEYLTQEEYEAGVESTGRYTRAVLNPDFLTDGAKFSMEQNLLEENSQPLRLEGILVDTIFTPRTISVWSTGAQTPTWVSLYDNPTAIHEDAQTVTLYATRFHTCFAPKNSPLTYRSTQYESLAQLVQTLSPDYRETWGSYPLWSGPNLLMLSVAPTQQGFLVYGAWSCPWLQAAQQLWWVYLLTLGLGVLVLVGVRRVLCHELLSPIQQLSQALATRQQWLLLRPSQVCRWEEGHRLQEQFQAHGAQWREQKDEIQRLNQALTYAKTAEEHRRTFTSHMAHELKTPLAVVSSYAQGLQEHIAEDKREKYLATICSEAERMNGMVLELLDLSRLEAGRVKLRRESFSLSQLTRSTLDKLSPALEAKGLRLSTCLESPAPVLADRGRMAQVVENLLTNAIKYTPAGGEIGVEVSAPHGHTTLVISNDCPPIPPGELEQLFEPFYRRPDAAPGEGTGLGLAIVRHIVQLHGGSCTAQTTPSGVQFTVTL
ncbi:HAMP domain-containing sensor histidine kinase [Pseudoflavonifractor sp. An85]|uniref:sensor histidine kinase n=1 Tax=Pseudoflavonifractor sp. An85 TaxID=1965661 RepID=UPI000B3993FF|nr:HAMP domain-containing sensor histidine kinase [Pseudoflavonifractor sp. An85]OUN20329.1 hypothetical protein B5G37_12520 [Pseudoflavonifractor sp. An85]